MIRLNIGLAMLAITALVGVYALKYSVGRTAAEQLALERQIERQQAELSLLKADWAFLNQPAQVAPIVLRHSAELKLQTLAQEQFGRFESLPPRPGNRDARELDSLFAAFDAGVDPIQQLIEEAQ